MATPLPRVTFKSAPSDFRVDEVPSYEPSGAGDHVYVKLEKTNLTTDDVVRRLARATGVHPRDVGVAGLKDKVGVTTQQISLALPERKHPDLSAIEGLEIDGVKILSVRRHGNKLRTGHLVGNRFAITLRDVASEERMQIAQSFLRAGEEGVPNHYGQQRFGRDNDNDARALAWLSGKEPGPRDPKKRRFLFSALQSRAFNDVLEARISYGTSKMPIEGDLLVVHRSGGIFASENLAEERGRAERLEVSPTGPMPGASMKMPTHAALVLEGEIVARVFGAGFDFAAVRALGEGTRRPLRVLPSEVRVEIPEEQTDVLRVYFVLPKGAYATTVLANAVTAIEPKTAPNTAEVHVNTEVVDEDAGNTKV